VTENIFHITSEKTWLAALELGEYVAASLGSEGFIHCSTREQVVDTANRYYHGQVDLLLLEIDPKLVASEILFEESHGELFPHIYGPINLDAVQNVSRFAPNDEGDFQFPDE
jgi:uncharacterized protein (DUF952 family)